MEIVGITIAVIVVCLSIAAVRWRAGKRRERMLTARQVRYARRYKAEQGPTHALAVPTWQPPDWPSRVRRPGNLLYGDPYAGDVHHAHDPWSALYASRMVRGEYQDE